MERLSPEELLAVALLLGRVARWTHQKAPGCAFELALDADVVPYPEAVILRVLERINAKPGWTAERDRASMVIHVRRDRSTRKPFF